MDFADSLPGPHVVWLSPDARTAIVRHCAGVYALEHDGQDVMPAGPFGKINAYVLAEFVDLKPQVPSEQ